MILAALAAAALQAPPAAAPDLSQASGLEGAQALAPFFDKLKAARTPGAPPVVVLQLGDSHSAADHISGPLRARLQARFGEGGRGVLPPGSPYKAYNARQLELQQSQGWRLEAAFLPGNAIAAAARSDDPAMARLGSGPFGLAGFRLTSTTAGASLTLHADAEARFDRAVVCAMAGPGAGELDVKAGDTAIAFPLAAPVAAPRCSSFTLPVPADQMQVTAPHGPVSILSWASFRSGGVAVSNLGVIGARIDELAARDDAVLAAELKAYSPDLILVAFGTNDGFQSPADAAGFAAKFQAQIERLKRLAPQAAVLVMGPPDADTSRPDIPLDGVHNLGFDCSTLSATETAEYGDLVKTQSPALARWYPPPALSEVREAERRVARAEGAAFWDWQARMGGPCSAHRLAHAETPLVRGDHIHFNSEGGDMVAGLLWRDLMAAYDAPGGH